MEAGTVKAFRASLDSGPLTMDALKTVAFFRRVMRRATRDFYNGSIDAFGFIGRMADLISDQFRRAWNQGARDVGYPLEKITDSDRIPLQAAIDEQADFLLDFAEAVEEATLTDAPIAPLLARVDLWANRYEQVANDSRLYFSKLQGDQQRFVWRLGATEEHCTTCATLDGIVATAAEWAASGYHPQHAPNSMLECGGWRCDCRLEPTTADSTRGGIPKI